MKVMCSRLCTIDLYMAIAIELNSLNVRKVDVYSKNSLSYLVVHISC